ncbi:MAG: hypothetical protein A3H51_00585 [Candidatus Spechtbacteria bacterium RIFCSPLOWO2_02_FULL_38_8]|uniref:Uncharacterized protein n=1 Tax=Candidatus Spechtbacteria bacterium RIFCSPLOWO2_02_FULL_38_8 TaxID=1802164 RepID=A0A1G2HJU9_9BACT|nr:MAG: hypothetical protein A3H51_00585 [Candidatus Spechtbacteria bacterium RIFCSPLOWO2_02_FULL_38_8]
MEEKQEYVEFNQEQVELAVFLRKYNKELPESFPRATTVALKEFKITHPSLFKRNNMWSVDQHRKRVMDWLSSY